MPRVIITEGAAKGLERYRVFLAENNPQAAMRAGQAIGRQFALLETEPEIGRPLSDICNNSPTTPSPESGFGELSVRKYLFFFDKRQ
ncbi:MAG: type II toxin-antitoxin system RelE/ParE family toxin [Gammaproteobacteria bacterium]|nr:type II toxin-antitoxin system RelE/ParE family toxin [Gammaproteobacteria bacterium]